MNTRSKLRLEGSDEDVRKRVSSLLNSRHFPVFRRLGVEVSQGSLTLSGQVHSYYEKQVAINACQNVAGVVSVVDEVEVFDRDDATSPLAIVHE